MKKDRLIIIISCFKINQPGIQQKKFLPDFNIEITFYFVDS
jgi:hypothetical protein